MIIRRKAGESIVVGGKTVIEIIEVSKTRVKLGIRAPGDVGVIRGESLAVARENRLASGFVAARGASSVEEVLRRMQVDRGVERPSPDDASAVWGSVSDEAQHSGGPADMKHGKDTVGIATTARTHPPA